MSSSVFSIIEMLVGANRHNRDDIFDVQTIALDNTVKSICIGGGDLAVDLAPSTTFDSADIEVLVLPGQWDRVGVTHDSYIETHSSLIESIARSRFDQLLGHCSAVGLMAEAGKLDGHLPTSSWWLAESLSTAYDNICWSFGDPVVADRKSVTASSPTGYVNLVEHLVEAHCPPGTWAYISEFLTFNDRAKMDEPFGNIGQISTASSMMGKIRYYARSTPANKMSCRILAERLGLSQSSVARDIQKEVQMTTGKFLLHVKLSQVSESLKHSDASLSQISDQLGFSDEASLRRAFKRETGLTPKQFQDRFSIQRSIAQPR